MAPSEPNAPEFKQQGDVPNFPEERPGWGGYIEWERYPEKKKEAEAILAKYDFPIVCETSSMKISLCLQLCSRPSTN
jgi:sulfite oxidase